MYFIIKWRADNGSEGLYSGRDISFSPAESVEARVNTVTWYDQNGNFHCFDSGRIFVMNDSGKTISDWNLTALNVMAAERKAA